MPTKRRERIPALRKELYGHLYARARDFRAEEALLSSGVIHAVPETVEGSIQLRTAVLLGIGASDSDIEALLADFRRADYAIVRGVLGT